MNPAAARQRLTEAGWLSLMPVDFREALLDICVWKRFAAGAPLYAAGDPSGGIYGIAEGTIDYTAALGRADAPSLHLGKAVVWTGLGPLLSGQPRRGSIVAVERVVAAYAPLAPLRSMLAAQPHWWLHMAQELLIEFDVVTNVANDLTIRSAIQRCAATLLRVAGCRFGPATTVPQEAKMTQETLAAMANMSRSTVSTILALLVDRGLVAMSYRSIRLLDIPALQGIADGD